MNYALNDEKMFADITDGVAIIINSETGIYYGMNELGTAVYENLANGASVESILAALKAIDGAPSDIEEKLNAFIQAMLDNELVVEAASSDSAVEIAPQAYAEGFDIEVNEYNDAQELLLADPIHEVKEETGWTPEKDSIGYSKEETALREQKAEE